MVREGHDRGADPQDHGRVDLAVRVRGRAVPRSHLCVARRCGEGGAVCVCVYAAGCEGAGARAAGACTCERHPWHGGARPPALARQASEPSRCATRQCHPCTSSPLATPPSRHRHSRWRACFRSLMNIAIIVVSSSSTSTYLGGRASGDAERAGGGGGQLVHCSSTRPALPPLPPLAHSMCPACSRFCQLYPVSSRPASCTMSRLVRRSCWFSTMNRGRQQRP